MIKIAITAGEIHALDISKIGGGGNLTGLYNFVLGLFPTFAGILATLAIIWAAFQFLTAGGEPQKIEQAKKTLTWTIVGIVILAGIWLILKFVITGLKLGG